MPQMLDQLTALNKKIPKVIDARTHGVIDYCHATFFLSMALVCRKKNPSAAAAALTTGLFVLVQSLLTDYPLGAKPVIPFATHGAMDGGFAACSLLMPQIFGFTGSKAAVVFQTNAFVEATVVALTDFDSEHAREERNG